MARLPTLILFSAFTAGLLLPPAASGTPGPRHNLTPSPRASAPAPRSSEAADSTILRPEYLRSLRPPDLRFLSPEPPADRASFLSLQAFVASLQPPPPPANTPAPPAPAPEEAAPVAAASAETPPKPAPVVVSSLPLPPASPTPAQDPSLRPGQPYLDSEKFLFYYKQDLPRTEGESLVMPVMGEILQPSAPAPIPSQATYIKE